VDDELLAVAEHALDLVADLYLETARLLNEPHASVPDSAAEAAFELNYACSLSTESALVLIRKHHVWDADILARSVVEGSLKYFYLLLAAPDEMQARATEFFETVPDCQATLRLAKATKLLELLDDRDAPQWAPIREVIEIDSPAIDRTSGIRGAERRDVQRRWSFAGLVESMAERPGLEATAVLGFQYGMQSHHVHKDSNATGMIYEREERDPVRRNAAVLAHGARIVADLAGMAGVRATLASRVSAASEDSLRNLAARQDDLDSMTKDFELLWRRIEYPHLPHA